MKKIFLSCLAIIFTFTLISTAMVGCGSKKAKQNKTNTTSTEEQKYVGEYEFVSLNTVRSDNIDLDEGEQSYIDMVSELMRASSFVFNDDNTATTDAVQKYTDDILSLQMDETCTSTYTCSWYVEDGKPTVNLIVKFYDSNGKEISSSDMYNFLRNLNWQPLQDDLFVAVGRSYSSRNGATYVTTLVLGKIK